MIFCSSLVPPMITFREDDASITASGAFSSSRTLRAVQASATAAAVPVLDSVAMSSSSLRLPALLPHYL